MSESLSGPLLAMLGEKAFVRLAEEFGGTRLYVPAEIAADGTIAQAIGIDPARRLAARYGRDWLRIPLAREVRACHYRRHGLSNAGIAKKLGMTETGVNKLFGRMDSPPAKGEQLPLQL